MEWRRFATYLSNNPRIFNLNVLNSVYMMYILDCGRLEWCWERCRASSTVIWGIHWAARCDHSTNDAATISDANTQNTCAFSARWSTCSSCICWTSTLCADHSTATSCATTTCQNDRCCNRMCAVSRPQFTLWLDSFFIRSVLWHCWLSGRKQEVRRPDKYLALAFPKGISLKILRRTSLKLM